MSAPRKSPGTVRSLIERHRAVMRAVAIADGCATEACIKHMNDNYSKLADAAIAAYEAFGGVAQTAGHWAIQESVPSDGFECYFLLRDGITVAEICGPQSDQRSRDLSDLVSAANASASGGEAVAWTNEAQLGFLKDPTCADIPMAMWAKHGRTATIPLYAASQQSPRLEREGLVRQCADVVGNMRQSEAGLFDAKHSGQRGCDRADALYDAYVAILALLSPSGPMVPWELDCQRKICAAPECECPAVSSTLHRQEKSPALSWNLTNPECLRCKGQGRVGVMACNDCGATGTVLPSNLRGEQK